MAGRNERRGLRCMRRLDIASFRTPPRHQAAPSTCVANHTRCFGARQLTTMNGQTSQRGGAGHSEASERRCLTLTITGRVNGNGRSMRRARHALPCMGLLDRAPFSHAAAPRAAPSISVAKPTQLVRARQLAAKQRRPSQRGAAGHFKELVRRCLTLPISGRSERLPGT
jgi:hypothetical protein